MDNSNFLLFLDLDGVLTPTKYLEEMHKKFITKDKNFHYRNIMQRYIFDSNCVENLNQLYIKCKYSIVLTSTRRAEFTLEQWNFIFDINDIKANIIGCTPTSDNFVRQDEIRQYISKNNINIPFIIVDDDIYDLIYYRSRLIHVLSSEGYNKNYFNKTLDILKWQGVDVK